MIRDNLLIKFQAAERSALSYSPSTFSLSYDSYFSLDTDWFPFYKNIKYWQ